MESLEDYTPERVIGVIRAAVGKRDLDPEIEAIITGPEGSDWRRAVGSATLEAPIKTEQLDSGASHAMGLLGDGALLARPDGCVVGFWPSKPRDPEMHLHDAIQLVVGERAVGPLS